MRLAHVLVLMLSCGCSLETRPSSAGSLRSVRTSDPEPARQPVSFEAWRSVDWSPDAGSVSAADGGEALSTHVSPDAGASGAQPSPARGSADNVRPHMLRTQAEAGAAGQLGAAGQSAVDAAVAPVSTDDMDAGAQPPKLQGSAGAATGAGAGASAGVMSAGAGGEVSAVAGQRGAAGLAAHGGMDAAVAMDAAVPLVDAGEHPDASDRDGPYHELLVRVLDTLERARGAGGNLSNEVRELLELPEAELTRAQVADVLVRLSGANVCRFDNASDCAALCDALERDCSVCRRDSSCELSVTLMCTPQWGFTCNAR